MENNVNWKQEQMFEVLLKEPDDFLKIRETLSRIGVASRKEKKLYQSCHILHKQGSIILFTSKNYLHLMVRIPTCQKMISQEETQ